MQYKIVHIISVLMILMMLFACKREQKLKPGAFEDHYTDNIAAYTYEKKLPDYTFSLEYQPVEYLVLKEFDNPDKVSKSDYDSLYQEFAGMQYYVFRIKMNNRQGDILQQNISGQKDYSDRVQYLSFHINNDFSLVQGNDTLQCLMHHFERNYGLAPYIKLYLAFEEKGLTESRKLIYNDQMFNSGTIKIEVPQQEINKIPNLIFE